jgi:tetratricopeptide (TPR) repeat protein
VAFSLIAGIRIFLLEFERPFPQNTIINFKIQGSEKKYSLHLTEFREKLVATMLAKDPPLKEPRPPLNLEKALELIGTRYILLAPLFGYKILSLIIKPSLPKHEIKFKYQDKLAKVSLLEFRELIRTEIKKELSLLQKRFVLEPQTILEAKLANQRQDPEKVIKLLGSWFEPLSTLFYASHLYQISKEEREKISYVFFLLCGAYKDLKKWEFAEEAARLGIQYSPEGEYTGKMYKKLGDIMLERKEFGQAIGMYRRALKLGVSCLNIYSSLGWAFLERKKYIAGLACLEKALNQDKNKKDITQRLEKIYKLLGPTLSLWQSLHPKK